MSQKEISLAKDFSKTPFGRHESDGPFSAEAFRNKHLIPALQAFDVVSVQLDGVLGFGASFLEEAFGGLTRHGLVKSDILTRLNLVSRDKYLIDEINRFIERS